MAALFQNVDCVELYVSDVEEGLRYYRDGLGLKLLWRTQTSAGLGMENDIAEIVIQTERRHMSVDIKVESVADAVAAIALAGGRVVVEPFDIPIGKCAVIGDAWGNQHVILDMTKGKYTTDENGYVTGVSKR